MDHQAAEKNRVAANPTYAISDEGRAAIEQLAALVPEFDHDNERAATDHAMTGEDQGRPRTVAEVKAARVNDPSYTDAQTKADRSARDMAERRAAMNAPQRGPSGMGR